MSGIGGNQPTYYQYHWAEKLKTAAENLATTIDNQASSRATYVSRASEEFRGYFSEVFTRNAGVASRSATELVTALGGLSGFVDQLITAAEEEDQRREQARDWAERQRQRENNFFVGAAHEVGSWFGWSDDPQPPPPNPEPVLTAERVSVTGREIPAPTGGSSTSSAVPADLQSFKSGIAGLDATVEEKLGTFSTMLGHYEDGCNPRWGTLHAQSLVTAVRDWLTANEQDTAWAAEVAGAFEAAGGSGVITIADASIAAALASAGINSHRDGLTIEPFSAIGTPPTSGYADDPVNTSTGNFLEPEHDLVFSGGAASLRFTRMYNSLDDRTGVFGLGWSAVLDTRLELDDDGARFMMADGRQVDFSRAGEGWDRAVGENYWLSEVPSDRRPSLPTPGDRILQVSDNMGGWWAFNTAGVWLGAGSGAGTAVMVQRNDTGQIVRLVHERGRWISVEYAGDRVASIDASDGRRLEYLYDVQRRLVGVSMPSGTRHYRWNAAGLIDRVISETGVIECENFYDATGRVIRQLTPYGRSVRFAYLRGRVTSVSTDDGTGANTWIADRKGRVVGIVDAEGNRQSMAYDPHGNIVSSTDRDGQITVHAYDDRGRKIRTVTPDGADLTYGYDEHDRVTTVVTAAGGVIDYDYATDDERNPVGITDALGGRTELTWHNGLLQRVVDPEGVTVTLDYDTHGELIAVTNAHGDTARIIRDATGRIIEVVSPGGHSSHLTYGPVGELVSRRDADGAIWRYETGAGGQLTAVVDPLGHRTELEYGPHGEVSTMTDPLGRVTSQHFDELGNLAAVVLPDGAQWTYTHDALSRLREVRDPADGRWTYHYDVTGELAAAIDPTGVRTDLSRSRTTNLHTIRNAFEQRQWQTDEYGRLLKTEHTDGGAELISYDAAGRPVELVDADGGLTKVAYDLAGRITAITSAEDRTVRYAYDACGRVAVAIDPTGGRTTLSYDADSRVIARTSPAGELTTIAYDAMGRVVRETIPGVGVARYRYDKLGRLIGVQDSRYGQRSFAYDAASQLIKVTNGLGGTTHYAYDQRGRVIRVTDPVGRVTELTYHALHGVASVTDPLNRAVKTRYDAAGRMICRTDHDGNVTEWTYDAAGRETTVSLNGRLLTHVIRDDAQRTATIKDASQGTATSLEHRLTYNRRGQLIERTTTTAAHRETTRWDYDADGYRRSMTTPDGVTLRYDRDANGRVTRVHHGTFGQALFDYDADGRITQARAAAHLQTWTYAAGYPAEHTVTSTHGTTVTRQLRDADGRILELTGPHGTTSYAYDAAGQLISATAHDVTTTWSYDLAGRMVSRRRGEHGITYLYDLAGQLLMATGPQDTVTTYEYNGQGHRILELTADATTKYSWDARGWLTRITEHNADGVRQTDLTVNALGELTEINDTPLHWDMAAGVPSLVQLGDASVYQGPAGFTGLDGAWQVSGWRAARDTDQHDPWHTFTQFSQHTAAAQQNFGLGADGTLQIAGLQWMGARAYDPRSASFLSQDPLVAPLGAAWSANPYAYAGNDPLHAIDPHGLAPITDAELQAYANGLQGPLASGFNAAVDWVQENREILVAGTVIALGAVLTLTGAGSPAGIAMMAAGGAMIGGGAAYISERQSNPHGEVDWGNVAVAAVIGGATGGFGAWAGGVSAAANGSRALLTMSSVNAGVGGTASTLSYGLTAQDPNAQGYLAAFLSGSFVGGLTGAAGPAAGTIARNYGYSANSVLSTTLQSGMNFAASGSGSVMNDILAGREISMSNALMSGATSSALTPVNAKFPSQHGTSTLQQTSYFGVRSVSGLLSPTGPNAGRLMQGSLHGSLLGSGVDQTLGAIVGN